MAAEQQGDCLDGQNRSLAIPGLSHLKWRRPVVEVSAGWAPVLLAGGGAAYHV